MDFCFRRGNKKKGGNNENLQVFTMWSIIAREINTEGHDCVSIVRIPITIPSLSGRDMKSYRFTAFLLALLLLSKPFSKVSVLLVSLALPKRCQGTKRWGLSKKAWTDQRLKWLALIAVWHPRRLRADLLSCTISNRNELSEMVYLWWTRCHPQPEPNYHCWITLSQWTHWMLKYQWAKLTRGTAQHIRHFVLHLLKLTFNFH